MAESKAEERLPAPHGARLAAWLIDLLIVSTVLLFLPQPLSYLLVVLLFVAYHTLLTWLLGETLGKALFGLRIERPTKSRHLLWSLGRSGVGYLFIDVFGLGCLLALFNRRHLCAHDFVFGSVVTFDRSRRFRARSLVDRLIAYAERQRQAVKAKKKSVALMSAFWASLEYIGTALQKFLNLLVSPGQAASSASSGSVATVLSGKAAIAIGVAATAVTTAIGATVPELREFAQILVQPRYLLTWNGGALALDEHVIALFEFDQSTEDISGNRKHGTLIGGNYVETELGSGLQVPASGPAGLDWSDHAMSLIPPYTVEIILSPRATEPWGKLFSFDDAEDGGWYYKEGGIQSYPQPVLAAGRLDPRRRHYLAFVVRSDDQMTVYFQGRRLGETSPGFAAPPPQAVFFRDDSATGRGEQLEVIVDAMRISNVARGPEEIAAVQAALDSD